ncbi:dephospho-CoA kinase [Eubacteriales bacterium OttesenSCG-928-M02]|nr:dephospho-CoA kinase [Eubacteriales bacterium OttesenSCG-928-M02]
MREKQYIIGITGNTGSGKSTVTGMLKALGAVTMDADAITRKLQEPGAKGYLGIKAHFGSQYFLDDGRLDRKALGALVFGDQEKLKQLNAIIHPLVTAELERQTEGATGIIVWDIPLLFESGMDKRCDSIWLVQAPETVRKERIMARDGITTADAEIRMKNQKELASGQADVVIKNDGDMDELFLQVKRAFDGIKRKVEHI